MFIVLDTNILLLDANNITLLGKDGDTIVLPETVLAETDSKKGGFEEINFQARAVARLLERATITNTDTTSAATTITLTVDNVTVQIISLDSYAADATSYGGNDRRIIEVSKYLGQLHGPNSTTLMTNDMHMKFQSIAAGVPTQSLKMVEETEPEFVKELLIDDAEVFRSMHKKPILDVDPDYLPENYSYKFTNPTTAQMKIATIDNGIITVLAKETETKLRRQDCAPINSEQLLASKAIQDPLVDLTLIEGLAGSGKNIITVSNAIDLVRKNRDKYTSIAYIRSPQNDESAGEDIGYLSGNDEKLALYLGPMEDTLDFIVRNKINTKNMKKVDIDLKVEEETSKLIAECGAQSMISTGLRGRTFHNTIFIIDEAQNTSTATMQKILSRVGKNCKVIVVGSMRQIDSKYVTKYSNGFAKLLDEARNPSTTTDIGMFAITLHKVVRSDMALFAEELFSS